MCLQLALQLALQQSQADCNDLREQLQSACDQRNKAFKAGGRLSAELNGLRAAIDMHMRESLAGGDESAHKKD